MNRMKRLSLIVVAGTLGLLSCTESSPTGTGEGSLSLEVVAVTVAPSSGAAAAPAATGAPAPLTAPSRVGPITVDSARIVLSGPASRTVTATPGTNVTINDLPVGTYTATLEGWGGDELVYGGGVSGIQVTGGATSNVTQVLFAPTRLDFIAINETVQLLTPTGTSWSSGNSGIVSITSGGLMTAKGNGTISVTGSLSNSTVQIVARVAQQVDSVAVTPASPTIAAGATQQFAAAAFDSLGTAVTGVSVLWVSSNHNVATVSQSGLATGVGAGSATVTATVRGQPGSASLTVNGRVATQLAFLVQPVSTTAGEPFSTAIQVEIRDAGGARVTAATHAVTLKIDTNPSTGALGGTATVNAVNGVATFSGLEIDNAGAGYTLAATASGLTDAISAAFDVDGGTPAQLVFAVQPQDALPGSLFPSNVLVEIRNASGGRTSSTDAVTIAIDQNPGAGTLFGTRTVNAVNGVATFDFVGINNPGPNYTLTASAPAVTRATSAAFNVGAVAVFANTSYVDYIPGSNGSEASNLEATYQAMGWQVRTITDVGFPVSDLTDIHVLSIPEQENGAITPALTAGAIANIDAFVSAGGTLIIHYGAPAATFINTVFAYAVTAGVTAGSYAITASAGGTSFQGGPAAVAHLSATSTLTDTSLPGGSLMIYRDAGVNLDAAVVVIPRGFGQIVFVGWDWFDAPPVGSAVGGNLWAQVLARASMY